MKSCVCGVESDVAGDSLLDILRLADIHRSARHSRCGNPHLAAHAYVQPFVTLTSMLRNLAPIFVANEKKLGQKKCT